MKEIQLTKGKFTLVDDEDYDRLMAMGSWHLGKDGYARMTTYLENNGKRKITKPVLMHRVIMNAPKGSIIDHANRNTLDNRRVNLRYCNKSENGRNRDKPKSNTSGFKGVSFHPKTSKWRAVIWLNYKRVHIGMFEDKIEAAKAYNEAAAKLHGPFAKLNQV